jgi:hypothetical protein
VLKKLRKRRLLKRPKTRKRMMPKRDGKSFLVTKIFNGNSIEEENKKKALEEETKKAEEAEKKKKEEEAKLA